MVQEAFLHLWELRARISSMYHAWCFLRLVLRWKCYAWHRQRKAVPKVVYTELMEAMAVASELTSSAQVAEKLFFVPETTLPR